MSEQAWPDQRRLPENVRGHCLGPFHEHADGRLCGYHNRLELWTFSGTHECLRPHALPEEECRQTPDGWCATHSTSAKPAYCFRARQARIDALAAHLRAVCADTPDTAAEAALAWVEENPA